jgi:hypothetical protein
VADVAVCCVVVASAAFDLLRLGAKGVAYCYVEVKDAGKSAVKVRTWLESATSDSAGCTAAKGMSRTYYKTQSVSFHKSSLSVAWTVGCSGVVCTVARQPVMAHSRSKKMARTLQESAPDLTRNVRGSALLQGYAVNQSSQLRKPELSALVGGIPFKKRRPSKPLLAVHPATLHVFGAACKAAGADEHCYCRPNH